MRKTLASQKKDMNKRCDPYTVSCILCNVTINKAKTNKRIYTFSQKYSETPDLAYLQLSNENLVRRNSLSLRDRTPPYGSVAEEILSAGHPNPHYTKAKSILSNLKDMADSYRFSDFASYESLFDETDTETLIYKSNDGFQKQRRRPKRKKDKLSPSPSKEYFLKKPNVNLSPSTVRSGSQKS